MPLGEDADEYPPGRVFLGKPHHCVICGSTKKLIVHHIDDNHENNDLENLVILCRDHHRRIHGTRIGGNLAERLKAYDLKKDRGFWK